MSEASAEARLNPEDWKLPQYVRPSHYKVELVPDLVSLVFTGRVFIKVQLTEAAPAEGIDRFWLNAHPELKVHRLRLVPSQVDGPADLGQGADPADTAYDKVEGAPDGWSFLEKLERIEVRHAARLFAGDRFVVHAEFAGVLNNEMAGFYRTSNNSTARQCGSQWGACTQFESLDARRCFVCFDEPSFKAIFELVVTAPKDLVCVSNMPVARQEPCGDSAVIYHFQPSPVMSTYLVTVVIGEYEHIEATSKAGVLVRVFTPPGKTEQGRFALNVAVQSLEIFADYFEQPYPLPKLDLLAVSDFAAGAMEGWGATTYREDCILVDPQHTASSTKFDVCLVTSHEVAHQWFGNLSTMTWWDDLWLNESFATYLEYDTTNKLYPEWKAWDRFVCNDLAHTLALDSLLSSHPVQNNETYTRQQVDEVFDVISYSKGCSVIRMLVSTCGEPVFQRGMAAYMKRFAYRNTVTRDLWDCLTQASGGGLDVGGLMEGWITQTGYPLLTVLGEPELIAGEDGRPAEMVLRLEQRRFLQDPEAKDPADPLWNVPIHVELPESHRAANAGFLTLGARQGELRVALAQASLPKWFKLNAGQEGLYRVRYSRDQLQALFDAVAAGDLGKPADQIGLLNDTLALCRAAVLSTREDLLPLIRVFAQRLRSDPKPDASVWSEIDAILGELGGILAHAVMEDQGVDKYRWFCRWAAQSVIRPAFEAIGGWNASPDDPHTLKMLRNSLMAALVRYRDPQTLREAAERVANMLDGSSAAADSLASDLRGPALVAYVAQGGAAEWERVLAKLSGVTINQDEAKDNAEGVAAEDGDEEDLMAEQKLEYLFALAAAPTAELLDRSLELSGQDLVRGQDLPSYLGCFLRSRSAFPRAWAWIKANWETVVVKKFAPANGVSRLLRAFGSHSSDAVLAEIQDFFQPSRVDGAERSLLQLIEKIQLNRAWMQRELPAGLLEFFEPHPQ